MNYYLIEYNDWEIRVEADTKKKAKYIAWLQFSRAYSIKFIDFVRNISSVRLLKYWE